MLQCLLSKIWSQQQLCDPVWGFPRHGAQCDYIGCISLQPALKLLILFLSCPSVLWNNQLFMSSLMLFTCPFFLLTSLGRTAVLSPALSTCFCRPTTLSLTLPLSPSPNLSCRCPCVSCCSPFLSASTLALASSAPCTALYACTIHPEQQYTKVYYTSRYYNQCECNCLQLAGWGV